MYKMTVITRDDIIKHREPVIYDNIRTASFTTARVLLTDDKDQMTTIRPDVINNIIINPINEEVIINE